MNWLISQAKNLFASHKTAISAIAVSAALAGFQTYQNGHVNWSAVGAAAVTTIGALAKSPLTPKQDPPNPSADSSS